MLSEARIARPSDRKTGSGSSGVSGEGRALGVTLVSLQTPDEPTSERSPMTTGSIEFDIMRLFTLP